MPKIAWKREDGMDIVLNKRSKGIINIAILFEERSRKSLK